MQHTARDAEAFFGQIAGPLAVWESLFDAVPDIVFFLKDAAGRYRVVNQTLAERCGFRRKTDLIGKSAADVFPAPLGRRYLEQDLEVVRTGRTIADKLELHIYRGGVQGWCLTTKVPLQGPAGKVVGLAGISRDLRSAAGKRRRYEAFAGTLDYVRRHFDQPLRIAELARMASVSVYQYEQRMKKMLGMPAGHFIRKTRLEEALRKLAETPSSVADIALACGYYDQSAFTRHFKAAIGMPPSEYRRRVAP